MLRVIEDCAPFDQNSVVGFLGVWAHVLRTIMCFMLGWLQDLYYEASGSYLGRLGRGHAESWSLCITFGSWNFGSWFSLHLVHSSSLDRLRGSLEITLGVNL